MIAPVWSRRSMMESCRADHELMDIEIDALFTHTSAGRIIADNEPGGEPAPRFFFARTRDATCWRVRHDVSEGIARKLEVLAMAETVRADLEALPVHLDAMLEVLRPAGEPTIGHCGPTYRFPDKIRVPTNVTRITRANLHLLRSIVPDMDDLTREFERGEPSTAMVVDGVAVATCWSSRLTNRAAEAGVVTLDAYRGRGYASAVTAAWARAVRGGGRIPFYSTSWDNLASQAVARKLGLIHYGATVNLE